MSPPSRRRVVVESSRLQVGLSKAIEGSGICTKEQPGSSKRSLRSMGKMRYLAYHLS